MIRYRPPAPGGGRGGLVPVQEILKLMAMTHPNRVLRSVIAEGIERSRDSGTMPGIQKIRKRRIPAGAGSPV